MDFYTMEMLERIGDIMDELAEWAEYDELMAENSTPIPTDEEMVIMANFYKA